MQRNLFCIAFELVLFMIIFLFPIDSFVLEFCGQKVENLPLETSFSLKELSILTKIQFVKRDNVRDFRAVASMRRTEALASVKFYQMSSPSALVLPPRGVSPRL